MSKRKLRSFLAGILIFVMQFTFITPFTVRAGTSDSIFGSDFPFVTSVTLTDTDNGETLGGTDVTGIPKNAHVSVTYDYEIPLGKSIPAGTTYNITLPSQIALFNPIEQDLTDDYGETVAHLSVAMDGTGTLTFTDYTSTHSDVGGTFTVNGYFNSDEIGNTTPVSIPFYVEGSTNPYTVDVYFSQPTATNSKTGVYDAASGITTWTVQLNTNQTTINNGQFTDNITPGHTAADKSQTYVDGSFQVLAGDGGVIYDSSASSGNSGVFTYTAADASDTSKTGTLNYAFDAPFSDARTIVFKTSLADPSQYFGSSVSNTASFTHDGITQWPSGTASVPTPNYISKIGNYNSTTKQIDWTVTFNGDSLSLHGVKITDPLLNGLTLDTGSVVLDQGTADETAVNQGTGTGEFTYADVSGTPTLVYDAGDITAQHTLTFSTELPSDYWQKNHSGSEFSNTATMTSTDNVYLENGASATKSGVGVSNTVISKTSAGYDSETHRITWQIVVNSGGQDLPDATLTDVIPAGQEYLPSTFQITGGAPENGTDGYQFTGASSLPADPNTTSTTLAYAFGHITSSQQYTITYQTELTDPNVWAGNVTATNNYSDKVTLDPGPGISSSTVTAYQTVNPTVLSKTAANYDYTTHEITWQIVVNQSRVPLTDAVVTDALNGTGMDAFSLEQLTIQLNGVDMTEDESATPAAGTYSYNSGTNTLTFHLGDLNDATLANRTKTITFKTKLNKTGADYDAYFSANGDHTISNTASLTTAENPTEVKKTASQTIHNTLIGKTGYYTSGKAYIDWAVEIDQNGITLNDLKLKDTLQEGLELDTSSVKLYKQTLNADGSYTPAPVYSGANLSVPGGTAETLTKDNVVYDAATREFDFTMPSTINQPYLLVFRTTVDAAYSSTQFSNSISFSGATSGQQSTSSNQPVGFSAATGKAWGTTGDVTVQKADSANGSGLAGAKFALYDNYGNMIRISDPTDSNGDAVFGHLQFGVPYTVKEYQAPANYEFSSDSYSFMLDSSGQVQLLDSDGNPQGNLIASLPALEDTRKVCTVSFTKTGDGGAPLAGAAFTLCDSNGNPVTGFGSVTTDSTGIVTFSNVPYGSYQIKETSAPTGYLPLTVNVLLDDSNSAIQTSGTTHTLDLGNEQDQPCGSITVTKTGAEYVGAPTTALPGAGFAVYNKATGKQVGSTQQTDQYGQAVFSSLPVGDYTLKEVSTPADYQTAADYDFTVSGSDTPLQRQIAYSVTDDKEAGNISFTKTDGTNPLPGAQFALYDSTGTVPISNADGPIAAASDETGLVQFTNVPYGDYTVLETAAPNNYTTMSPVSVSIHDANNGVVSLGSLSDSLMLGTIRFVKTNGAYALQGAEFTLSGNGVTKTATSDLSGVVEFDNIPFCDTPYTISETQTPAPYYAPAADFQVTLNYQTADAENSVVLTDPVVDVPLGSISFTKTAMDGTTPLAGAVFELYDSNHQLVATSQPTGSDGKVEFDSLPLNPTGSTQYTLHEKTAPVNYDVSTDQTVTLYNEDGLRNSSGFVFKDALKTGMIQFVKEDQDGNGLAGATFGLYDFLTGVPVLQGGEPVTAVSQTGGVVTFSNIPYGGYTIREINAPADYIPSTQDVTAFLTDTNPDVSMNSLILSARVTNTIKTANIQFTKYGVNHEVLPNAVFMLYDAAGESQVLLGGEPVVETSGSDGVVRFQNIPYGDYTIVETAPPADYTAVEPIAVSLHDDNEFLSDGVLQLEDAVDSLKLGTISFTKQDENGSGLAGATFILKDAAGNQVGESQISDADGLVTFTGVSYGDEYSVTETKAPVDYNTLDAPVTGISLHAPQVTLQSLSDSRLTGTISFTKVDENGSPLKGAEFTLLDPAGNAVGTTQVSDEKGLVAFTDVPFLSGYTVRETKAPENYAVHADFTVNLHTASYDCGAVTDELLRGSITVNKTDPSGNPLAGASFTLYSDQGDSIAQAVSGSDGLVVFQQIPYGAYTVKETQAPEGYVLDENAISVALSAQNTAPAFHVVNQKIAVLSNRKTGETTDFPLAQAALLLLTTVGIAAVRKKKRKA